MVLLAGILEHLERRFVRDIVVFFEFRDQVVKNCIDLLEIVPRFVESCLGDRQLLLHFGDLLEALALVNIDAVGHHKNLEDLPEELEGLLPDHRGLVLEPANDLLQQRDVHVSRHVIFFRQFQEHLDDLLAAIRGLVVEPLQQQLQKFLLCLMIDLLLVLVQICLVLPQGGLDDVTQDFYERLAKRVRIAIEETKEPAHVQIQRFGSLL